MEIQKISLGMLFGKVLPKFMIMVGVLKFLFLLLQSDFPKRDSGLGTQCHEKKTDYGRTIFWNHVDQNINGFLTQEGYWTGLTNIKPPIRLQLSPYLSYYTNHFPSNLPDKSNYTTQVNGGMDLKWGINQSFTLDATLIPDFGQVQSDAQVLNLTPFEVRFNENRSFFTEGTELFNKGGLFYSRRIGGTPINLYSVYDQLGNNESVISNPTETKLLNATKISGRTQHGLGIGVLNAVTSETTAIIENKETGEKRSLVTDPLTNYNVFVLNKSLKYNSSVSLINTNVLRTGSTYDANVSAFYLISMIKQIPGMWEARYLLVKYYIQAIKRTLLVIIIHCMLAKLVARYVIIFGKNWQIKVIQAMTWDILLTVII